MTTDSERSASRSRRIARWSGAMLVAVVLTVDPGAIVQAATVQQDDEPTETVESTPVESTPVESTPEDEAPEDGSDAEPAEPADVPVIVWVGAGIVVMAALGFAVGGARRD